MWTERRTQSAWAACRKAPPARRKADTFHEDFMAVMRQPKAAGVRSGCDMVIINGRLWNRDRLTALMCLAKVQGRY